MLSMLKSTWKFVTNLAVIFFVAGTLLIIVGQTSLLHYVNSGWISKGAAIHTVIKTVGGALVGSGVFTAMLKSSQYAKIFSNIIGEIVWSDRFIAQRKDKLQIWSMISKQVYEAKFPQISDEIEEIITKEYFPTNHDLYLDEPETTINIRSYNDEFWESEETLKVTIRPKNSEFSLPYPLNTLIDLADDGCTEDITSLEILELSINGVSKLGSISIPYKDEKYLRHEMNLPLGGSEEYKIFCKRKKVVCKKTNPDKIFSAKSIMRNVTVNVIFSHGIHFELFSMGTVKKFVKQDPQTNGGTTICSWEYKGLVLPHQGFIMIFK